MIISLICWVITNYVNASIDGMDKEEFMFVSSIVFSVFGMFEIGFWINYIGV